MNHFIFVSKFLREERATVKSEHFLRKLKHDSCFRSFVQNFRSPHSWSATAGKSYTPLNAGFPTRAAHHILGNVSGGPGPLADEEEEREQPPARRERREGGWPARKKRGREHRRRHEAADTAAGRGGGGGASSGS
jgi:hypothetical protein